MTVLSLSWPQDSLLCLHISTPAHTKRVDQGVNSVSLKRARKKARKRALKGFLKCDMSQLLEVPNILVQKRAPKRARKCNRKRARDGKWHRIDALAPSSREGREFTQPTLPILADYCIHSDLWLMVTSRQPQWETEHIYWDQCRVVRTLGNGFATSWSNPRRLTRSMRKMKVCLHFICLFIFILICCLITFVKRSAKVLVRGLVKFVPAS